MNLPNFQQSHSLAAILRDVSKWSLADINQAGRSKTVRNTYESIQMNFTFNSRGKIWNCSLNLPFLHPHATISSNNSNTTTSVRISLVDSTVRNNLCHPSFDSNVKYESNNITASSSRPYHAGILIFWSTRTVIRRWSPCLPHKGDRWPAAEWKQHGAGWYVWVTLKKLWDSQSKQWRHASWYRQLLFYSHNFSLWIGTGIN